MSSGDDLATLPAVHRLEFALDWPPHVAAAYLIEAAEPILVDAGVPGDDGEEELRAALRAHGYTPADVEHLVVTHPHSDHIGQVNTVREAADATVYAPEGVRERLERSEDDLATGVRTTASAMGLDDEQVETAVEEALDSLRRDRRLLPPDAIDVDLPHDEVTDVGGFPFETIHTPGHQADHACYQVENVLFGGDMAVEPFRSAALNVGLDRDAYGSVRAYYTAYDRLAGRDVERVYPGHGPTFENYAEAVASSVESLDQLVADTRETLGEIEPATPVELAEVRAPNPRRLTVVLCDTVGALGYLEGNGQVEYAREDGVRKYRTS